jgi:hypothetical protein
VGAADDLRAWLAHTVCVDCEASALDHGFPIEIAVAEVASGAVQAWLIRPPADWLARGIWSSHAEAVHGLALAHLLAEGLPAAKVADQVHGALAGKDAVSDMPQFDGPWLAALFTAAQPPHDPPRLLDLREVAAQLAARCGRRPDIALGKAEAEAMSRFPQRHRAAADARRHAEILRQIAGLS